MNTNKSNARPRPVSAFHDKEGVIGELVLDAETGQTTFAVAREIEVTMCDTWVLGKETLIPIVGTNNLLVHRAVLLPEGAAPIESVEQLIALLGDYLDRYVDLSPAFRTVVIHYVLLTWVYDAFNELPYLRFRGEPGSGKTRALIVIGSLCYQAFLASGASSVASIFRTLDTFRGTFVFDEADFRFSDEKLELVKILNNGNMRGFPVFRSVQNAQKAFDPQAFHVFGPKIIAMRHGFADRALESRMLTEEMGQRPHRKTIPLNLPPEQEGEARVLRNLLLSYRFQYRRETSVRAEWVAPDLSSRMNQILVPLLSVTVTEDARATIVDVARHLERYHRSEQRELPEARLVEVLASLFAEQNGKPLPVQAITTHLQMLCGADFDRPITARYVGSLLRKRLHLTTYKTNGVYVVPASEAAKVSALTEHFGIKDVADRGSEATPHAER